MKFVTEFLKANSPGKIKHTKIKMAAKQEYNPPWSGGIHPFTPRYVSLNSFKISFNSLEFFASNFSISNLNSSIKEVIKLVKRLVVVVSLEVVNWSKVVVNILKILLVACTNCGLLLFSLNDYLNLSGR